MTQSSLNRPDVIIVGAGVLGASCALALVRHGYRVVVVDRFRGVGHGSTSASAGIVRVHATDVQSSRLADDATAVWQGWSDFLEADDHEALAGYRQCGTVILDDHRGYAPQVAMTMAAAGVQHESWDAGQLADNLPYLDIGRFGPPCDVESDEFWDEPDGRLAGAVYTEQSGYIADPALAAANLMDAARRGGVTVRGGCGVRELLVEHDRVNGVRLDDGEELHAPVVLVAAGPHTDALLKKAHATDDFTVTTRRLREELHHIPGPEGLDVDTAGVHVVDPDLGINFRPEPGQAFLVGGNGDQVDGQTVIEDPDQFDERVTATAWNRSSLRLARRIRGLGVPPRRSGVVGLYDVTDDWLPIYDRTGYDGLFVAFGTSGNQFKTAPLVGDMMRHVIETELAGIDHHAVEWKCPTSGHLYRTDQFSRRRTPIEGGSRG